MADRVAAELERHFQRSAFQADDELVLGHPQTGKPYDASKMRARFFAPDATQGAAFAELAFGAGTNLGTNLRPTQTNSDPLAATA